MKVKIAVEANSPINVAILIKELTDILKEDCEKVKSLQRAKHEIDIGNAQGEMKISNR